MTAELGGCYAHIINSASDAGLVGLVDMRMHPAAQLGFGTELVYREPDGDPAAALRDSGADHFGDHWDSNVQRRILVRRSPRRGAPPDAAHDSPGWPSFTIWPS